MNNTELELLKIIADMEGTPSGAFNIRANGGLADRKVTENIDIRTKTDKPGIDIIVKPGTKGEKVHIPVIISETGLSDLVYNDFIIGENADVEIVAEWQVYNIKAIELETAIHRLFRNVQLALSAGIYVPKEWYVVPYHIIEEGITRLINGERIKYDARLQTIITE